MAANFRGDQIFMDFITFLIHEVLYVRMVFNVYLQCLVFRYQLVSKLFASGSLSKGY